MSCTSPCPKGLRFYFLSGQKSFLRAGGRTGHVSRVYLYGGGHYGFLVLQSNPQAANRRCRGACTAVARSSEKGEKTALAAFEVNRNPSSQKGFVQRGVSGLADPS